jgi:hypothetical protein
MSCSRKALKKVPNDRAAFLNRAMRPAADFDNVGRNILRGPGQRNVDIALTRRFPLGESHTAELSAEFFNLLNQVNLANSISNVGAAPTFSNTGMILAPGDFGRIVSTRVILG